MAFYGAADGTAPLYGLTEPEEIEACPGAGEAVDIIQGFNVESLSCVNLVKVEYYTNCLFVSVRPSLYSPLFL